MNSYALGLSEHITRSAPTALARHVRPADKMSACAGQRTSGEASGWVWWSVSRTDWNHGHGCSHAVGASQPKQQGSTVQLLNIISSPVPLSASAARLEAAAAPQDAPFHRDRDLEEHWECGRARMRAGPLKTLRRFASWKEIGKPAGSCSSLVSGQAVECLCES